MFFRLEFIDVSQSDVETISEHISKEVEGYLSYTSDVYFKHAILTTNFKKVIEKCESESCVAIHGLGKLTLVVLFALCLIKGIDCIFLSSRSFSICDRICEKGSYTHIRFCNFEEA